MIKVLGNGEQGTGNGDAEEARRSRVYKFMRLCGSPNKCPSLQKRSEGFSLSGGRMGLGFKYQIASSK